MSFWTQPSLEPKRNFRFKLIDGNQDTWWWAKTVDKPSFDVSNSEYQLINHKFKYPGIVTWKPITITVADYKDVTNSLIRELGSIGYVHPEGDAMKGLAKDNQGFIKGLSIQQLNAAGIPVETWTVKGAFVTSVSFSKLDYSSDDITEVTIEVAYDYAKFE